MTVFAWVLASLFVLSLLGIPLTIGTVRTAWGATFNALWHIVFLAFLILYLVGAECV